MKDKLLNRLESLTKKMDVPTFKRTNTRWLAKNLGVRNSKHPNYIEVVDIVKELLKIGVAS